MGQAPRSFGFAMTRGPAVNSPMRLLILCTGNSCRSQMAAAFVQRLRPEWEVHSAGTLPADGVHPMAIQVLRETGLDLSAAKPRAVRQF